MNLPLCQLPIGATGRVHSLTGDPGFCQRVRELGFVEMVLVAKIAGHGPFLLQVNGARLGLSSAAAAHVIVSIPEPA
jgi:Fe2+ transport system protein FeoA